MQSAVAAQFPAQGAAQMPYDRIERTMLRRELDALHAAFVRHPFQELRRQQNHRQIGAMLPGQLMRLPRRDDADLPFAHGLALSQAVVVSESELRDGALARDGNQDLRAHALAPYAR